jgi:hypothetical protein
LVFLAIPPTAQRDEALAQQTVTADILAVISSSQAQLKPLFETIVDRMTHICGATFAGLGLFWHVLGCDQVRVQDKVDSYEARAFLAQGVKGKQDDN